MSKLFFKDEKGYHYEVECRADKTVLATSSTGHVSHYDSYQQFAKLVPSEPSTEYAYIKANNDYLMLAARYGAREVSTSKILELA